MNESNKTISIRVLYQSPFSSIISDAVTILSGFAFIGIGIMLESSPMQWLGFIMFISSLFSRFSKSFPKMTFEEARQYIDKIEEDSRG